MPVQCIEKGENDHSNPKPQDLYCVDGCMSSFFSTEN